MKLTKTKLQQIIKEETLKVLRESLQEDFAKLRSVLYESEKTSLRAEQIIDILERNPEATIELEEYIESHNEGRADGGWPATIRKLEILKSRLSKYEKMLERWPARFLEAVQFELDQNPAIDRSDHPIRLILLEYISKFRDIAARWEGFNNTEKLKYFTRGRAYRRGFANPQGIADYNSVQQVLSWSPRQLGILHSDLEKIWKKGFVEGVYAHLGRSLDNPASVHLYDALQEAHIPKHPREDWGSLAPQPHKEYVFYIVSGRSAKKRDKRLADGRKTFDVYAKGGPSGSKEYYGESTRIRGWVWRGDDGTWGFDDALGRKGSVKHNFKSWVEASYRLLKRQGRTLTVGVGTRYKKEEEPDDETWDDIDMAMF